MTRSQHETRWTALAVRALSTKTPSTKTPFPSLLSFCTFIALFAAVAASPARSQSTSSATDPATTVDEEIVVSASLTEIPQRRSGSSVTVLGRDEIERRHKTTVLELLRTIPGLEVAANGGPGKTASVFIRGGNSAHTLVLVDGVRVNGNSTGAFDFSDLTADNLERIEVLRGPQGVLYGSEAVAGVVSIVTRRGSGPAKAWIRGAVGSDDYSEFGAGVSGGLQHLDYNLSVSSIDTDGVSAASESAGNTEADPWQNLTVSGRLGTDFWDDGRLDVALRYIDGETDLDGFTFGVGPTDDLNALQERSLFAGSLILSKPFNDLWTQKLIISNSQDDLVGKDPDNFFSNFEITSDTSSVLTQADLTLSESASLSLGYRFEQRDAATIGSFDESVDVNSFFGESLWSWGERFDLSLGLRHDDHSVFGNETTYRLAMSAGLGGGVRLHGSAGSGFKAPTFNDLYFPGFGNLGLAPETSEGFDVGFEWSLAEDRWVIDVTYFDTDFDDLILFTFPGGFVNVAEATSSGVELTLGWRPSEHFSLSASHTYNDTEDLATGLQLARRPESRSTLTASFDVIEKLRGSLTVIAVSDRIDSDGAVMDDYERLDLSLDYRLTERWHPFLRLENLLDSDYAEIPGFTTPGATAAVGVQLNL